MHVERQQGTAIARSDRARRRRLREQEAWRTFYDPSAWANVTEARYGNTGRNQFYGPGFWNDNMSLFRTFPLRDTMRLQFRVEGFSITNHPHWNNRTAA